MTETCTNNMDYGNVIVVVVSLPLSYSRTLSCNCVNGVNFIFSCESNQTLNITTDFESCLRNKRFSFYSTNKKCMLERRNTTQFINAMLMEMLMEKNSHMMRAQKNLNVITVSSVSNSQIASSHPMNQNSSMFYV